MARFKFAKALGRELGKNTGKWISNKVFGDGHSTLYRLKIQRERQERQEQKQTEIEERKRLREEARQYKLRQKEEEKAKREREKELAALEKEYQNYIQVIQSVHDEFLAEIEEATGLKILLS